MGSQPCKPIKPIKPAGAIGRDPATPAEWQEAVDSANFWLVVDSARMYGLIKTDVAINVERCEEILARGLEHGVRPNKAE